MTRPDFARAATAHADSRAYRCLVSVEGVREPERLRAALDVALPLDWHWSQADEHGCYARAVAHLDGDDPAVVSAATEAALDAALFDFEPALDWHIALVSPEPEAEG